MKAGRASANTAGRATTWIAVVASVLAMNSIAEAQAQAARRSADPERGHGEPLHWLPSWNRFDAPELAITAIAGAGVLATLIVGPKEKHARGGELIDEDVRDALRAPTEGSLLTARDMSDLLLTLTVSYPYLVDALLVAGWYRDSPHVAQELALINAEVLTITMLTQSLLNVTVSRERPYGRTCGTELDERADDCVADDRFRSFFSGHTSQTFASAGLTCMHHLHLPLYGEPAARTSACLGMFAFAAGTGVLRIVGDRHYFTDVAMGALVGTFYGLTIPWLFHYRNEPQDFADGEEASRGDFEVKLAPTPTGLTALGTF